MVLLANQYVVDLDVAQDLVQDVFAHLFQKSKETIDNPEAYFFTAIRNRCLDFLKTQKIRDSHHNIISHVWTDTYFEQALENAELENFIMQSIEALPLRQRHIFKESRIQGKSNSEIARDMNLSKRTIETQISNALKTLRAKLTQFQTMLMIFF